MSKVLQLENETDILQQFQIRTYQYGLDIFTIKLGKMFAINTRAVPPSEIFFAPAIIMTYGMLFSSPMTQKENTCRKLPAMM